MKIEMDHYVCRILSLLIIWVAATLTVYFSPNPNIAGGAIFAAVLTTLLTW